MELTIMLAAILAAILNPENIFRFAELVLKSKVVLKKILIDLLTKMWLLVTFWC